MLNRLKVELPTHIFGMRWALPRQVTALLGPLHLEPMCTDAAVHSDGAANAAASVRILGIQKCNDPGFRGDHANLAEARTCDRGPVSGHGVGLVSELPNIGRVPAIHLEGARRRPKIDNEGVHVLSDIMGTEALGNFLP
jgi:hypothetical protein